MLTSTDAADNTEAPPAPEAAAAAPAKTAPASEPDAPAGERDATGKFVAKEPADPPGVAKRIGKALAAQRAAEQRAADAEAKLQAQTESRPAPAKPAEESAQPATELKKPVSKDFDTYEAYVEALTDWKLDAKKQADDKAASDRRVAEAETAAGKAWNDRVEAAKAKLPDFEEKLEEAGSMPISRAMHATIYESELGPEVAYYFASHPEEAARIAKLSDLATAREIGKIEASLAAPPARQAPAAAAKLPKPPAQAGGSHTPSVFDFETADPGSFRREFAKQLANAAKD